jgi:PKD repeat protein
MRASNKTILFGIVLISLIFTCGSFPHLTDTYAMLTDTKHVDATLTAAVWDTQNNLVGLSDLKLQENGIKLQGILQGINGKSNTAVADNNSSDGNSSYNGSSEDNLMNNSSAAGNTTFNMTADNQTANNLTNQTADNQTADNLTNDTIPDNGNGMGGGSFGPSGSVLPVANFSSNTSSGYSPLSVQFTDLSENATNWEWDFGDGATSSEQNPADHTYSLPGTYYVNLIVTNGNGTNSIFSTITVLEKPAVVLPPVANFSSITSLGFVPFSVQFTDLSENATAWSWDFGDGTTSDQQNPAHIYSTAGDYNVKLTATNTAGTDSETKKGYIKVRIASTVKLTSITLDGENSTGVTTNLGASTTNTGDSFGQIGIRDETGVLLNQPYSGGSLGEVSIPLAYGINNFTLVADGVFPENTKYGAVLFLNGVTTPPQIAIYNSNDGTGKFSVQPAGTNIIGSANGGLSLERAPGTSVYVAPDGTKAEVVSFVVDSKSGNTDEISGENIGSNGIPDTTAKLSLKVMPSFIIPVAAFTASPTSGNAPLNVAFTDASTGYTTSWKWNFGDGTTSTDQNPAHTYSAAGSYTVTLAASNGNGTNSISSAIAVLQPVLPVADFSSSITSGYAPLSVQFTDLSKNAAQWNWNFGDGTTSTEESPAHTYSAAGSYTVSLTATNANGTNSKLAAIKVLEQPAPVLPVADFSSNVTSGSVPLSVQFTDLSKDASQWNWNFGDDSASTEQNPDHVYYTAGKYTVTLTASNSNGQNTKTSEISVDKSSDNSEDGNSTNNSGDGNSTNNS